MEEPGLFQCIHPEWETKKTDDQLYVSSFGCAASDAAAKEFEWTRNLAVQRGKRWHRP